MASTVKWNPSELRLLPQSDVSQEFVMVPMLASGSSPCSSYMFSEAFWKSGPALVEQPEKLTVVLMLSSWESCHERELNPGLALEMLELKDPSANAGEATRTPAAMNPIAAPVLVSVLLIDIMCSFLKWYVNLLGLLCSEHWWKHNDDKPPLCCFQYPNINSLSGAGESGSTG